MSHRPSTLLLLDDDTGFRKGLAGMLRADGFDILDFPSPLDVPPLETLEHIDLVITDYQMPGENGLSFADRWHQQHPDIKVILVSAFYTVALDVDAAKRDFLTLMPKPIDYDELFESLTATLTSIA